VVGGKKSEIAQILCDSMRVGGENAVWQDPILLLSKDLSLAQAIV